LIRAGLAIPRSTLAQWVGVMGVQSQPLVDALPDVVLKQHVIHADETHVQMLARGLKKHKAVLSFMSLFAIARRLITILKTIISNYLSDAQVIVIENLPAAC
jgi:hypothetical protein